MREEAKRDMAILHTFGNKEASQIFLGDAKFQASEGALPENDNDEWSRCPDQEEGRSYRLS